MSQDNFVLNYFLILSFYFFFYDFIYFVAH
jgi:hypothetical protein